MGRARNRPEAVSAFEAAGLPRHGRGVRPVEQLQRAVTDADWAAVAAFMTDDDPTVAQAAMNAIIQFSEQDKPMSAVQLIACLHGADRHPDKRTLTHALNRLLRVTQTHLEVHGSFNKALATATAERWERYPAQAQNLFAAGSPITRSAQLHWLGTTPSTPTLFQFVQKHGPEQLLEASYPGQPGCLLEAWHHSSGR